MLKNRGESSKGVVTEQGRSPCGGLSRTVASPVLPLLVHTNAELVVVMQGVKRGMRPVPVFGRHLGEGGVGDRSVDSACCCHRRAGTCPPGPGTRDVGGLLPVTTGTIASQHMGTAACGGTRGKRRTTSGLMQGHATQMVRLPQRGAVLTPALFCAQNCKLRGAVSFQAGHGNRPTMSGQRRSADDRSVRGACDAMPTCEEESACRAVCGPEAQLGSTWLRRAIKLGFDNPEWSATTRGRASRSCLGAG